MPQLCVITAELRGAGRVALALRAAAAEAGAAVDDAVSEVGTAAENAYRTHARRRTGAMARSIGRARAGRTLVVGANASDPRTGFDYLPITRHGHRVAYIYPRLDRAPASVVATRRPRAVNTFSPVHGLRGNAALRFVVGGRVLYRRRVRGFRPAVDWAELADPAIDAALDAAEQAVLRRVLSVAEAT